MMTAVTFLRSRHGVLLEATCLCTFEDYCLLGYRSHNYLYWTSEDVGMVTEDAGLWSQVHDDDSTILMKTSAKI